MKRKTFVIDIVYDDDAKLSPELLTRVRNALQESVGENVCFEVYEQSGAPLISNPMYTTLSPYDPVQLPIRPTAEEACNGHTVC